MWKDARALGTAAGEAAVQLGRRRRPWPTSRERASSSTRTRRRSAETVLTSIFLTPIPITQDNLNEVVDAGWITVEELCSTGGTVGPCAS